MNADHNITPQHLDELPIFPLAKVVLFPDTIVPLHIFEPRYRELTRYCLDNNWPLAIANIDPEAEDDEQPAVLPIAGAGFITQHQELPDGRFNILVKGVARVRIGEELATDSLYRVVRAEVANDITEATPTELDEKMQTLRACLVALGNEAPSAGDAIHRHVLSATDPAVMTNVLSSMMMNEPEARQRMLEEVDVAVRLDKLTDRVSELLVEIGPDSSDMH